MKEVKEIIGTCAGCGQTKVVHARTRKEADEIATQECSCKEGEQIRRINEIDKRLGELIGEEAPEYGWEPAGSVQTLEAIKEIAHIIAAGGIESAGIRINKTNLKIGSRGGKISIERSKTIRQGGLIDK